MSCNAVREALTQYAHTKLPSQARAAVAAHLSTCSACRQELDRIRRVDVLLYEYLERQPVRGQRDVHRALEQRHLRHAWLSTGRFLRRGGELAVMASLGAALIVLILSVGILGQRLHATPATPPTASPIVATGADSLQLESINPPPGTLLKGPVLFKVQIGYHLVSAPQALLSVRVVGRPVDAVRYFSWAVPVRAEEQHATVQFTMDAAYARELFGSSTVQIETVLRAPAGTTGAPLLRQQQWTNVHYELP